MGPVPEAHLLLVHGDREQSERLLVQPEGDGARWGGLQVPSETVPSHREELRVGGRDPQAVVPTRRARRELLPLEERHRRPLARELERARRADDPATHDHNVRHAGGSVTRVL
jgi:hypothetical protein